MAVQIPQVLIGNPRRIWVKYVIAIALILASLIGAHVAHLATVREARADAEIINLSGRQRMLSQRIVMLAAEHAARPSAETIVLLGNAIDLFETSHTRLIGLPTLSDRARAHYFGPDNNLDTTSRQFLSHARIVLDREPGSDSVAAAFEILRAKGATVLLGDLNRAVSIFEEDAVARNDRLTTIQNIALLIAILIVISEGVIIFGPAQISVNRALQSLEERNARIDDKNVELEEMTRRLAFSAYHDPLTGLANRKRMIEEVENWLAVIDPEVQQVCILHIDLDRFKEVNDTLGHLVGDGVLARCAEIMRAQVREKDLVARIGGDEFVIAIRMEKDTADKRVPKLADTLIRRICKPMTIKDVECQVGASIGYVFSGDRGETVETLIGNADIALYEAKRNGRGQARAFSCKMRAGLENRVQLVRDIELAFDADEFVPFLQPQVSLSDGRITGFEVLARWRHATRGVLAPDVFIPLAEETGMIDAIDRRIMLAGLDELVRLRGEGWSIDGIAVNASARSLRSTAFRSEVVEAVRSRGLSPRDVSIEVLESTLIEDNTDQAVRTIRDLGDAGFDIHIDDFGTGYASLSNLATLDLTGLKIDRSLIMKIEQPKSAQVVAAIIGLAKAMSLQVIAEGIETPAQFNALKRLDCDIAQGFGISAPMPADQVGPWLETYGKRGAAAVG